jgi:hypothetical protein
MALFDKLKSNPSICGVEVAFTGELIPSNITDWQQFYNATLSNTDFQKVYASSGSVTFNEETSETISGTLHKQKITIRFPSNDEKRSDRLMKFNKVRFIKIKLTNGKDLVIGRNDIQQNSKPKISMKSNHQLTEISFETVSIFASGFVPNSDVIIGFPSLIPILLY